MPDTTKRMGRPSTTSERRNLTMAWPLEIVREVDAMAAAEAVSRTEFVLRAVRKELARVRRREGASV